MRRLTTAGVLSGLILLAAAPPASAAGPFHGDISVQPGSPQSRPTVTGSFVIDNNLGQIDSVTLTVSPAGPQGAPTVSANGCEPGVGGPCGDGKPRVSFSWAVPALAYNGPYEATASARGRFAGGELNCLVEPCRAEATPVRFRVAVRPTPPEGVRAVADPATRVVTLTWARNSAPDTIGYVVRRRGPGEAEMKYVGERVPQPASGPVTYTDRETAQGAGGYEYQVVAIRPGGDGNRSNQLGWLLSDPSATTTSSVGAPPAASLGFGIVGGRLVPNSSAAGRGAAVSEYPPDTGYRRELPYKGVPPPTSVVIEEAAPAAPDADSPLPLGHRKQPLGSRALLLPVLGAAVLFSGALGLRYLSRRVG